MATSTTIQDLQAGRGYNSLALPVCLQVGVGLPGRTVRTMRPGLAPRGFTLIELLLVLALLAMAVAVSAPSLSRFFRGRTLESEARRMLALTRYAQSRAVAEGVPMIVWFRPQENTYGLEAESSYTEYDPMAITNQLDSDLKIQLDTTSMSETVPWNATTEIAGNQPAIRFTPDGYIADTSPLLIWIEQTHQQNKNDTDAAWLVMNGNHMNYELQSFKPVIVR